MGEILVAIETWGGDLLATHYREIACTRLCHSACQQSDQCELSLESLCRSHTSELKDTNGMLAGLFRKWVTAMGQWANQWHSNINIPIRVCNLPPCKHNNTCNSCTLQDLITATADLRHFPCISGDYYSKVKSAPSKLAQVPSIHTQGLITTLHECSRHHINMCSQ